MQSDPRRTYYSVRVGKESGKLILDVPQLNRLFKTIYSMLLNEYYFQEALGSYCVDNDCAPGTMGSDPEGYALLKLRKSGLFPISTEKDYSEEELFDLIEFLYDHVSKPLDGRFHSWNDCGWHYHTFDRDAGRQRYRYQLNEILADYGTGWELSEDGEIMTIMDPEFDDLMSQPVQSANEENITNRIELAVRKFRTRHSTAADRRDAVRSLADVLEFLRPDAKKVLKSKDEDDLFELANRFGIRHHTADQKTEYDPDIWHPWAFYYYLATIHATLALITKSVT